MAYLGNTPTTQSFISGTDYFNGDGATTAFTLTRRVNSVNDVEAVINNVVQQPNTAYNISGTTITFTSAPSAGTGNIYVRYLSTTTQSITPSQNTVGWNQLTPDVQQDLGISFKNRIINGAMVIDQRNAGASVTPTNGQYCLDRFYFLLSQTSKLTCQQNAGGVTPPAGFSKYIGVTSTSAYTVGASENFVLVQAIEGQNVADLNWGSVNAQTITMSFWVYSSITGTFGGAIENSSEARNYPFSYTINSANTWTKISITVVGDTTGTWLTTNGVGIYVIFGLGVGSSKSGTAGVWGTTAYYSVTGATSIVGTNGATWYMTGLQFEVGTQATTFDYRDYARELIMCQRYYQKSYEYSVVPGTTIDNEYAIQQDWGNAAAGVASSVFPLAVTMRASPNLTIYDIVGNSNRVTGLDSGAAQTQNVTMNNKNATATRVYVRMYAVSYYGISYMFTASAEL